MCVWSCMCKYMRVYACICVLSQPKIVSFIRSSSHRHTRTDGRTDLLRGGVGELPALQLLERGEGHLVIRWLVHVGGW